MKQGEVLNRVMMLVLFGAVLLYLGVTVWDGLTDPYTLATCYASTVEDTMEVTGFLVREEQVISGGGAVVEGKLLHGLVHPEMGHILLRPSPDDPAPHGFCPYHDGCLEGMANGPAIEKRWGVPARELPPEHPAWKLEAEYLAQMCVSTILTLSPERIVLGGGVMHQLHLFPMVRRRTLEMLGGYVAHPSVLEHIDEYIVPPALGDNSGAKGSLLLAVRALG